jgi:hypothetical protein
MWRAAYHDRYNNFVRNGVDYRRENPLFSGMFSNCHERMMIYAKTLNQFEGVEFFEYQCRLTRVFIPYAVRIIYNQFWSRYSDPIRALYKITDADLEAYIIATVSNRQNGKTTWMIINTIAMAMATPVDHGFEFDQGFASTGLDLSVETLTKLKIKLEALPRFQTHFRVSKWTQDEIVIHEKNDLKGRKQIKAYPKVSIKYTQKSHTLQVSMQIKSNLTTQFFFCLCWVSFILIQKKQWYPMRQNIGV